MQSKAATVKDYLASLPADRRNDLQAIRKVILDNLDKDYEEGMQYGMIGYYVPHAVFPPGYHCDPKQPLPFAGLASQKNYMAIYLGAVYGDWNLATWFRQEWLKTGKKLDMGKVCIRFKKLDDIPLDLIGRTIKKMPAKAYVENYQMQREMHESSKPTAKKAVSKKPAPAAKKKTAKKTASKAKK
jgi:hypothetical protein